MTQSVEKQIRIVPAIESELHLFQVGREMLGANSVPRSHDAALEKRERGLNGIGVNISHDVYAGTVVDFLVLTYSLSFTHRGFIRGGVIGEDYFHVLGDVLADVLCQRARLCIVRVKESQIAVALANANHDFLVVEFPDLPFAAIPAADIGNVHLDFAIQHWLVSLRHRMPDAVTEVPRGFITHSNRALDLQGGHSLLRFAEKVRREKPLGEWKMRIVKHGAGCNRKLVVTVFAVEELLIGVELDHGAFAAQALRAFREAQADKQFTALIFGAEQGVYIN